MSVDDQSMGAQATPQTGPGNWDFDSGREADDAPYPGLRPFRRDETHIFFGREGAVNEMVDRLAVRRFLAITGASGSGKSSLVRTGLLDALDRGLLAAAGPNWRVADFRPGDRPLAALTESLIAAIGHRFSSDESAIVDARLARGPLGLVEWLDEFDFPRDANLLLLVDQFEELFRFRGGAKQDEAEAFVALLLASATQRRRPVYVVITMRSDFLGECARFTGLAEAINDGQFLTPRLTRRQCEEAIEGPARVYGGRVEPALVTRLLNDMGSNPDQLPLMQHVLMLMWERASQEAANDEVVLTLADYEKSGGIGPSQTGGALGAGSIVQDGRAMGALSDHADQILARLDPAQQQLAAKLFRALVQSEGNIGRDMRRPVSLREAAEVANANPDDLIPVIEAFRAPGRNFLTPAPPARLGPDTIIDISHESLIRQWRTLRSWVREEFQSAETYRHVEKTAELEAAGAAGLMRNPYLGIALAWRRKEAPNSAWAARYGGNFDLAARFLDRSERRRTLRRWSNRALVACLVLAALGFAAYQYKAAKRSEIAARISAEAAKISAENERIAADKARLAAENERIAAENARLAAAAAKASAEEARRSQEALELAKRNFANELSDFNVPPQNELKLDVGTETPLTIHGAAVVTTPELAKLIKSDSDLLLIDALEGAHELSLPGARRIPFAGHGGSFDDDDQRKLEVRLRNLTAGDPNRKIVIFCQGALCWESYNACLRAEHSGYRNIMWYRGGLNAWQAWAASAGDSSLRLQSISQTAKELAQRMSDARESGEDRWGDAVSLSEAVPVLLGLPEPDIQGALDAGQAARAAFRALASTHREDADLTADSIDNLTGLATAFEKKKEYQSAIESSREAADLWAKLRIAKPKDISYIAGEARTLFNIGRVMNTQKDYDGANAKFNEAMEDDKKLLSMAPTSQTYLYQALGDYINIGLVHSNNNQPAVANGDFERSKTLAGQLLGLRPTEVAYKGYLCLSEYYLADSFTKMNNLKDALSNYLDCLRLLQDVNFSGNRNSDQRTIYTATAKAIGGLAYNFVIAKDFEAAIQASDVALRIVPWEIWINGNRAYALMFLNKTDDARSIFMQYKDKTGEKGWSWNQDVLKDFADLRKHGLSDPLMAEIEKAYGTPQ